MTATATATPTPTISDQDEICRGAGFWSTHSGLEKSKSRDITGEVIAAVGCLEICGVSLKGTDLDSDASAVEALCVAKALESVAPLARQLTAAALNCAISNGNPDCTNLSVASQFAACNDACAAGSTTATVDEATVDCIAAIECFNEGRAFDVTTATCGTEIRECASRPLVNEDFDLEFDPTGPAGGAEKCNEARKSDCGVIGADRALCETQAQGCGD